MTSVADMMTEEVQEDGNEQFDLHHAAEKSIPSPFRKNPFSMPQSPLKIREDVEGTLRHMMRNRYHHIGNYPSSEGNPRDKLMQWSHGATGVAMTLCKAAQVFSTGSEFCDAAIEAGEVVWKKGLVRKVGLADGIAGNAYAFLSLY